VRFNRQIPYFLILIVLLIALLQVIFFVKALKFDNTSQIFIFSNYISQCVADDIFPYWNPYIHLGSPFYGDLVSRFHYPLVWLFSYTTGYSFFMLHIEFFLVFFMTAVGFYKLLTLYSCHDLINAAMGITLSLSGFMLGHAQHLWIITSFCFFIWALYFIVKIIRVQEYAYVIPLGISLAFSLLGGYAGMNIILFYIYIVVCIYWMYQYKNFRSFFFLSVSIVVFLSLSIGFLYSLHAVFPYVTRTEGVSLDLANNNPFSPWSFLTLLNPGFIISDSGLFQTDLSMRNAYIGVFFFPVLAYSFRYLPLRKWGIVVLFSILFFGFSLGHYTCLRSWLYENVPLMNYFQYSALFRFVPVVLLIVLIWEGICDIIENKRWEIFRKVVLFFLPMYCILLVAFAIYFARHSSNVHRMLEFISILSIFPCAAMIGIIWGLKKLSDSNQKVWLIVGCMVLDMVGTTQVLGPLLIFNRQGSVYEFQRYYNQFNRDFKFVPNEKIKNYRQYANEYIDGYLTNGNFLIKTPTIGGYDNYKLLQYYEVSRIPNISDHEFIYTIDSTSIVKLTKFSPNQMSAIIQTKKVDTGYLLQNFFSGWSAKLNGRQVPLLHDNYFPKIELSKGENIVEFNYDMPIVKTLHVIQLFLLFIFIFIFFIIRCVIRKKQSSE